MPMQKVYIAGKVTGDDKYKQKFKAAEEFLSNGGFIVMNPSFLPAGMKYQDYIKICLAMIDVADVVFFLNDWRESPGARFERHYCDLINKTIISVETRETIKW